MFDLLSTTLYRITDAAADGSFELTGVLPGRYSLHVSNNPVLRWGERGERWSGTLELNVQEDREVLIVMKRKK